MLEELVKNNPNIEEKDNILILLKEVDKFVPLEYKPNFYKNVSNCVIKLNLKSDYVKRDIQDGLVILGKYDNVKNELIIDENSLKFYEMLANTKQNTREFFWNYLWHSVVHELFHMASSNTCDNGVKAGVLNFDNEDCEAINEGITEMLANYVISIDKKNKENGYFLEELIVRQITFLVGFDVIKDSYFGNKGMGLIKNYLLEFSKGEEEIEALIYNINENYKQDKIRVSNIQMILISFLFKKLEMYLRNGYSIEEISNYCDCFEQYFINSRILKENGFEEEDFDMKELDEVYKWYLKRKNDLMSRFSNNYGL